MTSACISKDTLRNQTQVFLEFRDSILRFVYISSTPTSLPTSIDAEQRRGNIKRNPTSGNWTIIISDTDHSSIFIFRYQLLASSIYTILISITSSNISVVSDDSDVFYVGQSSGECSPQRHNTPNILISTELSEQYNARMPSVSSIASAEPRIFTIDDDSNEPTMPYRFGRQLPIVPPSLTDLHLPPHPFNLLATMARANNTQDANDDNYSPESPEPSIPSPISTPSVNVSAFNSWETSYTTTGDDTFHSSDEPRRIYFLPPTPSPPPSPPRRQKRKLSLGMSFPKEGGVSQHTCEACGQTIPSAKDTPGPSNRDLNCKNTQTYILKHLLYHLLINSF